MPFTAIYDRHTRQHRRFRLTAPEGALCTACPFIRPSSPSTRKMEHVSASVELQGRFEGWPIPQLFHYSEGDWDFLEPLCRFLDLDSSLCWTGYFSQSALIVCMREAFWADHDRREYELLNRRPLPVSWCRSGERIRPVAVVEPVPRWREPRASTFGDHPEISN